MDIGLSAWALAAVVIVERLRPLLLRRIELQEKTLLRPEKEPVQIPPDLMGLALMDSEQWAQAEMLDGMRALYDECGDWDTVRVRYGVAPKE